MSSQELFLTHLVQTQRLIFSGFLFLSEKIMAPINFSRLTDLVDGSTLLLGISFGTIPKCGKEKILLNLYMDVRKKSYNRILVLIYIICLNVIM